MPEQDTDRTLWFHYRFRFSDGSSREFRIDLENPTLALKTPSEGEPHPDWTRLECHQCENCPLSSAEHPFCPAAAGMRHVIEGFRDCLSIAEAEMTVETRERTYSLKGSVQQGISSLIGLCMAASGCPVMDKLRPMLKSHLPFATLDETFLRVLTTYLVAQYFRAANGKDADWGLHGLQSQYEAIRKVNYHFTQRLHEACREDANLNALVRLDAIADFTGFRLGSRNFEDLERLFGAYLKE